MIKYRIVAAFLFCLMLTGICAAQTAAEVQTAVNNLDITAIKSLQIGNPVGGNYPAIFHILVDNKNKDGLRLLKGKYRIEFLDERTGKQVNIGEATFAGRTADYDFEILGNTLNKDITLQVDSLPVDRIISMINIIGDPSNKLRMTLKCDSEVALQVGRGWISKKGERYTVELNWAPQVQREVFMK